ncbi:MAG: GyrI-like domain-containing protein [Gammaproteobacteria bacterium]|nr:hypothetical protein [Gammaproteobacteria bacterium]
MKKIDHRKELKSFYEASANRIVEVEVPALRFLMVDGQGDPSTSEDYARAVEALFAVSYAAKFMIKKGPQQIDYAVMPLEGLWWADDPAAFAENRLSSWKWTMMIMQPDIVPDDIIAAAIDSVRAKKGLADVDKLRLETFTEGHCAQVLHVGPFSEEGPTIERLHAYIRGKSDLVGKHHEIYLTDVRRADPKKWKMIIRQPMR